MRAQSRSSGDDDEVVVRCRGCLTGVSSSSVASSSVEITSSVGTGFVVASSGSIISNLLSVYVYQIVRFVRAETNFQNNRYQ